MEFSGIITAVSVVAGCGLLISIFLSIFAARFAVPVNKTEEAITDALPGNNCGGCGYPGCSGLAAAIAKGEAPVSGCPVGGNLLPTGSLRSWALIREHLLKKSHLSNVRVPVSLPALIIIIPVPRTARVKSWLPEEEARVVITGAWDLVRVKKYVITMP